MKLEFVIRVLRKPKLFDDVDVRIAMMYAAEKLEQLQKLLEQFGKEKSI